MSDAPERPAQAAVNAPHWVIVNLSRGKHEGAVEIGTGWRRLYRHPTEALAIAECDRLAAWQPGSRFAVYASGHTAKVDRAPGGIPPAGQDVPGDIAPVGEDVA